mgnify:CR=1 FL=1
MNQLLLNFKDIFNAFPDAILAGLVIAIACSFLGVFVVLKRVVFIGATLSQVAACGIAAALFYHVHPFLGATIFTLVTVTILAYPIGKNRIPRDAIMGSVFILASGLSILIVSKSGFGLKEVKSLLYGDLILTSPKDLNIIIVSILPVMGLLILFLRPIIYTLVDREEAKVLGLRVTFWELFFFYALGIVVSASSQVGGMLLVFCYLVVPSTAALLLSNRFIGVWVISITIAIFATLSGFYFSYTQDLPTNQVIAVISCLLLLLSSISKISWSLVCRIPKSMKWVGSKVPPPSLSPKKSKADSER